MGKTLVIAGHGKKPNGKYDPGATGNGFTEADFIRDYIIPAMKERAPDSIDFFTEKNFYAYRLADTITGYDQIVELHLDAAGPSAEDGHIIIHKNFKPDEMDLRLRDVVKKHVGVRGQNGFTYRDNLYNCNVFARRGIGYRLIEMAFITNKKEMDYLKVHYRQYAHDLIAAILGAKISVTKPRVKSNETYTVKKGDTLWAISQKYGMSVAELKELNNLSSDLIYIGQVLQVGASDISPVKESKPTKQNVAKDLNQIGQFQLWLNQTYKTDLIVDGIFGAKTKRAAIIGLQTELNKQYKAGLKVDGIWGPKTRAACINVRIGARGNITKLIQGMLFCKGYNPKYLDGIFGQKTADTVLTFQRNHGLVQDGIVGKKTFEKLFA